MAPAPALGTEAALPAEEAQTAPGAETAAEGTGLMATDRGLDDVQPRDVVTVTPSETEPLAAALNAIVGVPAPEVISPPEIVQA